MTEALVVPTPHLVVDHPGFQRLPLSQGSESPDRIAFGSCNDQDHQNKLWSIIEARKPAAFVWGGDAIYADVDLPLDWSHFPPERHAQCGTPARIHKLYNQQRTIAGYRSLIQSNITIFGTIDDHDYGCNNADGTFPHKLESAKAFVDFIGEPRQSAMSKRAQAGHGVFGVKLFDFARQQGQELVPEDEAGIDPDIEVQRRPLGLESNRTVAVFVLDCRTSKTPWKTGSEAFSPDYQGDFLGERQWTWFETALRRSRASVNIVVNGLQVHGERFPNGNVAESWSKYPAAQKRLLEAMLQDGVESPVLVSGDVHLSQFSRKDCRNDRTGNVKSLVEMTTSGMTHSWAERSARMDDTEHNPTVRERYECFFASTLMHALHFLCPWTELMISSPLSSENGGGENAKTGMQYSLRKNFGELEFDWEARTVTMRAIGEDENGDPLLSARWSMDQLSGRETISGGSLKSKDFDIQRDHDALLDGEWTCVNHRGRVSILQQMLGHVTTGFAFMLAPFPVLVPFYFLLLAMGRLLRRGRRTAAKLYSSPIHSMRPKTPLLQ